MSDAMRILSKTNPTSASGELKLADLANAAGTYASSDPGPDPTFDDDPIPEPSAAG